MLTIRLPDGSVKQFPDKTRPREIAESIGKRLAQAAVAAKVNGQIITLSEFQNRQVAAAQAARVDPNTVGQFLRQNNARLLQEAIDEILILQKAEDAGIHAPSAWIDQAIEDIKKDNKITSDEQMQEALAREGLTLAELRANIERGVVRKIVMQRDVQPKIEASEADVKAEYEKLKASGWGTNNLVSGIMEQANQGNELFRTANWQKNTQNVTIVMVTSPVDTATKQLIVSLSSQ